MLSDLSGKRAFQIDADGASETPAFRAGAERVVEAEIVPGVGGRSSTSQAAQCQCDENEASFLGFLRIEHTQLPLTEVQRGLDRLVETRLGRLASGDANAILDDPDDRRQASCAVYDSVRRCGRSPRGRTRAGSPAPGGTRRTPRASVPDGDRDTECHQHVTCPSYEPVDAPRRRWTWPSPASPLSPHSGQTSLRARRGNSIFR